MLSTRLVAPIIALVLCSLSADSQTLQPAAFAAAAPIVNNALDLYSAPLGDSYAASSSSLAADSSLPPAPQPSSDSNRSNKRKKFQVHPFSRVALGVKVSMLGAGAEVATPLSRSFNLRLAANFVQFAQGFRLDGIHYDTGVNYRSGQLNVDWFPFHGGFHISPGILYFRQGLSGTADVPPGDSFQLDDVHYINSVDDPVSGTASFEYKRHVAPMILFGFSNIIPRDGKHFSVPFEFGLAYTAAPVLAVQLHGTACTVEGCFNAATDPSTQANLKQQIRDTQDDINNFPVYPIVSLGLAYRF